MLSVHEPPGSLKSPGSRRRSDSLSPAPRSRVFSAVIRRSDSLISSLRRLVSPPAHTPFLPFPLSIVAVSTPLAQRTDEDLINRSLLDSIDADTHSEQSLQPNPIQDGTPVPYPPYIPRQPSPSSMARMSFSADPFNAPDDPKRPFQRPSFTPFNPLPNGAVVSQPHLMGAPFRDVNQQKYSTPTVIDVYGPQDPSRQYEFRDPSRDFGAIPINKQPPPLHAVFHSAPISHHNQPVNGHHHGHREEEISTIFVVGFPDDMQEREFQNMFTFAKGFEAASLKVPHKDLTTHNGVNGAHTSAFSNPAPFNVIPEPFSAVTPSTVMVEQPPWPMPNQDDNFNHQTGANYGNPPRKQIIGFAKFRSRIEALEARDFLQGRKVDVERGAMLKAEMAKKNLHTKRGPGPSGLPLSMVGPGGMVGADTLASLTGLPGGAAGLPSQSSGEVMRDRERELGTLGAMGFIGNGSRPREREGMERERDQSAATGSRNRYGTSDSDAECEPNYQLRMANTVAFDAFHSLPAQPPRPSVFGSRSLMSPTESYSSLSPGQDGAAFPTQLNGNGIIQSGPWGPPLPSASTTTASSRNSSPDTDLGTFPNAMSGLSLSNSPPPGQPQPQVQRTLTYSSSSEQLSTLGSVPASSSSSVIDPRERMDEESDTARNLPTGASMPSIQESSLSDNGLEFSAPQSRMNSSDQNPPINTLYVGNLPTSPPPPGFTSNYLEDNLRNLFSKCEGYRKLCFRQKDNGPMCFVEFEDVPYASKALNELYGNQLNGLVKTGIRLSYSKNPLGVRSGNSVFRREAYHGSGPPWASVVSQNGVENKFPPPPPGLMPFGTDRNADLVPTSQRPMPRRDSIAVNNELSPSAPQFSFGSHPPVANGRFFPPMNGFIPSGTIKPLPNFTRPPSLFSPFPIQDINLTPIPREHNMHALTPSPSIESARAG